MFQTTGCFPAFKATAGSKTEKFDVDIPFIFAFGRFLFRLQQRLEDIGIFFFVYPFQRFRTDGGRDIPFLKFVCDFDASPFVETQFVVYEITGETMFVNEFFLEQTCNDSLDFLLGEAGGFNLFLYILDAALGGRAVSGCAE